MSGQAIVAAMIGLIGAGMIVLAIRNSGSAGVPGSQRKRQDSGDGGGGSDGGSWWGGDCDGGGDGGD